MYTKLLLGLFTTALLIGDVSAQSGSKSRNSNNAAAMRRQERLESDQINKITRKIEKNNFEGIKLETKQKRALKGLVKDNYEGLANIELKMERLIPEDKAKDLRRKYSAALRKGSTETEAMLLSMKEVDFPEALQNQIMTLSGEAETVHQEIATELSGQLNPEQKEAYMAMVKEKEKMAEAKEMNGQKMEGAEGSDTKMEAEGSGAKEMEAEGSGAKMTEAEGSDTKEMKAEGSGAKEMESEGSGAK